MAGSDTSDPDSAIVQQSEDHRQSFFSAAQWVCIAPVVALLLAAVYHQSLQPDPSAYRNSLAINVEFFSLIISLLISLPASFFYLTVIGWSKRSTLKKLGALVTFVVVVVAIVVAVWLDAATLLCMT